MEEGRQAYTNARRDRPTLLGVLRTVSAQEQTKTILPTVWMQGNARSKSSLE
jgi:hypothetical protein